MGEINLYFALCRKKKFRKEKKLRICRNGGRVCGWRNCEQRDCDVQQDFSPFCTKAKKALDSVGARYKVIEIENRQDMAAIQDYLLKKTGGRSVPRVFIHGVFYGGGDETAAGARNGDLKKKINKE